MELYMIQWKGASIIPNVYLWSVGPEQVTKLNKFFSDSMPKGNDVSLFVIASLGVISLHQLHLEKQDSNSE